MGIDPKYAVNQLTEQFNREVDALYHDDKRQVPRFEPATIDFHMKGINARYISNLFDIRRMAKSQMSAANKLEAQAQRSAESYLTDAELKSYKLRQSTIAQDAANMDIQSFCQVAAAEIDSGNRVAAAAYLSALPEPASVPEQRQVDAIRERLEKTIIPAEYQNAGERAHEMRLGATIADVAAKEKIHDLTGDPVSTYDPFA